VSNAHFIVGEAKLETVALSRFNIDWKPFLSHPCMVQDLSGGGTKREDLLPGGGKSREGKWPLHP
jgi:hypothetical protein